MNCKRFLLSIVAAMAILGHTERAKAGLFVAPSASDTVVWGGAAGSVDDSYSGPINLNLTNFKLFGTAQTQTYLGSNGYLTFGGADTQYANYGFPSSGLTRIAPFFDDLIIRTSTSNGTIQYNNSVAGQFTAIWNGVQHYSGYGSVTAEAVLLGAGNSYGATAGTIVFSYGTITSDMSPTVGLNAGDGTNYATLAGILGSNSDGTLTGSEAESLTNRSFTFTPNGSGGYNVTSGAPSAVPEPASLTMLGLGLVGLAGYGLRRRRQTAAAV